MVKNWKFHIHSNMESSFVIWNLHAQSTFWKIWPGYIFNQDCYRHTSCTSKPSQRLGLQMLHMIRKKIPNNFKKICGFTKTTHFPFKFLIIQIIQTFFHSELSENYPGISTRTQSIVGRGSHSRARFQNRYIKANYNPTICPKKTLFIIIIKKHAV